MYPPNLKEASPYLLLLKRKNTGFGNGMYSLPGGKIESGQTAQDAAIREAKEEIGIDITDLQLVHVVDRRGVDTEFYIFVFLVKQWNNTPFNNEPHKCENMGWFALYQLPSCIIPAHAQAVQMIQKNIFYSIHGYGT